jgi:cyclopropane fatty-acyl-phospholipid synthase-like methyltransferase
MSRFNASVFPRYCELSRLERIILRTCCYYPPRRNEPNGELRPAHAVERAADLLASAYGPDFPAWADSHDVLDFGCGTGEFVLALAEGGAARAVGVDILDRLEWARREAEARGLSGRVEFVLGRSEALPDASFDHVVSHDSFEHFDHPAGVFDEMMRLARPGGRVWIKFGPTWKSPYGRHMSGTFRKDRPWIHLVFPERLMMRVHSVYHNTEGLLLERYNQRSGGLNKMTIRRALEIVRDHPRARLMSTQLYPIHRRLGALAKLPALREYLCGGICVVVEKPT